MSPTKPNHSQGYEVYTGSKNPEFDDFMKCVANFVKERILDSHSTQNTWPQRIVCATHFIGCLFKRWMFVTLKWKSWFSLLGWYETDTQFHLALKACRDQFVKCLEASKGRMHLYLQPLSDTNLRLLMEQLELVAARNEAYAKEIPYVCLLEMAIEVSGRFRTELPLKHLDEKDPLHKSFNLDSRLRWSNAVLDKNIHAPLHRLCTPVIYLYWTYGRVWIDVVLTWLRPGLWVTLTLSDCDPSPTRLKEIVLNMCAYQSCDRRDFSLEAWW